MINEKIINIINNTKINILFGAGASRFNVDNPFPLMQDLLKEIIADPKYK